MTNRRVAVSLQLEDLVSDGGVASGKDLQIQKDSAVRGDLLPGFRPASSFGLWLRARNTFFQEFDLAVVVGFVFRDVKPFGIVVG
jgi:hypothetical protein